MKKRNLTNGKIHNASALELVFRMNCLHAESERKPQDDGIPMTDIWEANTIRKELKHRLGRLGIFFVGWKK